MALRVLVDGNNVKGSRPDGWWRNRAEAAQRLVSDIVPLAWSLGGTWIVVFDGAQPQLILPQERVPVVHTGHRHRGRPLPLSELRPLLRLPGDCNWNPSRRVKAS